MAYYPKQPIELTITHTISANGFCKECQSATIVDKLTFCAPFNEVMQMNKWGETEQCEMCKLYLEGTI